MAEKERTDLKKAAKSITEEHEGQLPGYLKSSRTEHGLLIKFGSYRLQIMNRWWSGMVPDSILRTAAMIRFHKAYISSCFRPTVLFRRLKADKTGLQSRTGSLNPIEKLWDCIQDYTANKLWPSIQRLDQVVALLLKDWWEDPQRVIHLVGNNWHRASANDSAGDDSNISC